MNAQINERLHALSESGYKAFSKKIISSNYEMLGIRMPALKKLAKELANDPEVETYLQNAEFTLYEHVLLYGLTLGLLKKSSPETIFRYLDPLILTFDNWAHVDTVISSMKLFGKHQEETLVHFLPLKNHEGEFTKRTFIIILMAFFMDEKHINATLEHFTEVPQGQYYVDMAIAWAISTGLVKYYEKTLPLLEQNIFSKFVHNKAIQKARESYRITPEQKEELHKMKIK
jgi:3-methyladenine DNA glycosylase AlkD